jgi:hypothetical protein
VVRRLWLVQPHVTATPWWSGHQPRGHQPHQLRLRPRLVVTPRPAARPCQTAPAPRRPGTHAHTQSIGAAHRIDSDRLRCSRTNSCSNSQQQPAAASSQQPSASSQQPAASSQQRLRHRQENFFVGCIEASLSLHPTTQNLAEMCRTAGNMCWTALMLGSSSANTTHDEHRPTADGIAHGSLDQQHTAARPQKQNNRRNRTHLPAEKNIPVS